MTAPGTWQTTTPEAAGLDGAAVTRAVELAQAADSAQLVVLVGNRTVVNETFDQRPVDVFAVQKGLVSLMLGMASARDWLDLDDPADRYLPAGWTRLQSAQEQTLTLRHLVTMTTGMDDALGPAGEIGATWRYNNTAYNYLKRILTEHERLSLEDLTARELTRPLGMDSTGWISRAALLPDGRPLTGLESTASDLARLGEFVLGGARLDGEQRIQSTYLADIAAPGSIENPAWGLMWWNNRSTTFRVPMREEKAIDGPIIPEAPNDLIAARGALENHLAVIPSLDMVVARTAKPPTKGERPARFERAFYGALFGTS